MPKSLHDRIGTGRVTAATKADSGVDPAYTLYGTPHGMSISADGTVKMTLISGVTISLALLGKVQYDYKPVLIWSTGTDGVTVYLNH
jgi:hypothetical protein